jgi:hypothetical protein
MMLLVVAGRRYRSKQAKAVVSNAIEGAVFALFGLLLAFTFSGAASRYDDHRKIIVEEANTIGTAFLRLDLLPAEAQASLKQDFREYAAIRQHRFDEQPDSPQSIEAAKKTDELLSRIWRKSVAAATSSSANVDATKLLLPALNSMIDITATRKNAYNMHPPAIIFLMLFLFAGGCAFMSGYSMESSDRHWLYTLALALTVCLTIYVTLEVEYPRYGLIHLTSQNEVFEDLISTMKQ